jgi:hypothetical protein
VTVEESPAGVVEFPRWAMFRAVVVAGVVSIACFLTVPTVCGARPLRGSTPPDLHQSYVFTPPGTFARLAAGTTYEASQFPIELRVTPPDQSWWSAQWKSGSTYFAGGGPPNFGWVHLAKTTGPASPPNGMISIMAAYKGSPSVAATLHVLRTRGHGATYDAVTSANLAGYAGKAFDGRITGAKNVDHIGHFFIPFSPPSHGARYYADEYGVYGDLFRVIVLNVRRHTVVIYIDSGRLTADQFAPFLDQAASILASLRFPT